MCLGLAVVLGFQGRLASVTSGAPTSACTVPLVFADCLIVQPGGGLNCSLELEFSSATEDNIGFTSLLPGTRAVSVGRIREVLRDDCAAVSVGDLIGVGNGSNLAPVISDFANWLARNGPQMTAPIVKSTCPNPQFNQLQEITGFATFTVEEIVGPPVNKVRIRVECG
jgi:hypothetical protein